MAAAERVSAIVVAAPPGKEPDVERVAIDAGVDVRAGPGGEYRSRSVALALEHVETEAVVVHDAARPLVAAILVDEVLRRLDADRDAAAVIAATPVMDTIKEASVSRRVLRTAGALANVGRADAAGVPLGGAAPGRGRPSRRPGSGHRRRAC